MSNFIDINHSNFQEVISTKNKLILIEASAPWCSACKSLELVLKEILADYPDKIIVGILNVDQNPNLIDDFKIMSVPTIIVFQDGQERKHIFGEISKNELLEEIGFLKNDR